MSVLTTGSRTKTAVDRNIKQAGLMAKDIGQQASYGVPYVSVPMVVPAKSLKPRKATIRRIEDQKQLRVDIKKYTPGLFYLVFGEDIC
jgi:hypothetical protein